MEIKIEHVLGAIGLIATLSTAIFGIIQYRRAQKWKRLEFVANEINEFESDRDIRNAKYMLDWEEKYIELYHEATDWNYDDRFILVNDEDLKASLTTPENDPNPTIAYSDNQACIRDTFDILFGYFEGFYANIKTGLISFEEYYPHILYWLDILCNSQNQWKDMEFKNLVREFLIYYGYDGVIWIFDEHLKRI